MNNLGSVLAALLSQGGQNLAQTPPFMSQQGGGAPMMPAQATGGGMPTGMPQQPPMPQQMPSQGPSGGGQPMAQSVGGDYQQMMQRAMSALQNPMGNTIPTMPQAQPQSAHPAIQALMQALGAGLQGFGYGSMNGNQQAQAQQLAAQKAEAMGRMAGQAGQLGLEQQRVGLEGQRVGEEQKRTAIEAGRAATERETSLGQLGESQKRTVIEKQRADQEHEAKLKELDTQAKQLEESIRAHGAEEKLGHERISVERQANNLAQQRINMEADHYEQQMQLAGKQYTRQLAEDERKTLHTSLDSYWKEHPYLANLSGTGASSLQQQHKDIDDYIDRKVGMSQTPTGGPGSDIKVKGGMPPAGATGIAPGSDGKKYYHDAQGNRLGEAPGG